MKIWLDDIPEGIVWGDNPECREWLKTYKPKERLSMYNIPTGIELGSPKFKKWADALVEQYNNDLLKPINYV